MRRLRNRQQFLTLVFVSGIVAAVAGDKVPFANLFSKSFPVFANFGTVLVEEGYLDTFVATPTATFVPPAMTALPEETPTVLPEPTQTLTMTATPTITPTSSPSLTPAPVIEACPGAMPSQLASGMKVVVRRNLNFRSSPETTPGNFIKTNSVGTTLEVIGGGLCSDETEFAYRWWQLKTAEGLTGWSVEASAYGSFYFLEPVE